MSTTITQPAGESRTAEATGTRQMVSFHLGAEIYGVEITKVREIILMCEITEVPQTPHYVRGLINLRNTVIPVIDLRTRFGLPTMEQSQDSRILVIHIGQKMVGIVVDGVDEVLRISTDQIAPTPDTVVSMGNEYLNGLVKMENQILILLDIDKILGDDREVLESIGQM